MREYDTVARLGGDEFVLLLPRANAAGAQRVAGKVAQAVNAPFQVGPHELTLGCSVGVALYPQDGRDFDALVQSADMAMYGAKRQGRNTYRFFTSQMQAQSMRALELENALRRALERVQSLLSRRPKNAKWTNCRLVLNHLSQFFHNRLFFSNQAKLRSTIQRLGITLNVCSSLRLAICTATCPPRMSWTPWANGRPT